MAMPDPYKAFRDADRERFRLLFRRVLLPAGGLVLAVNVYFAVRHLDRGWAAQNPRTTAFYALTLAGQVVLFAAVLRITRSPGPQQGTRLVYVAFGLLLAGAIVAPFW